MKSVRRGNDWSEDLASRGTPQSIERPSSVAFADEFRVLRDALVDVVPEQERPDTRYEFGEVFARGGLGQIRYGFDRVLGRKIAVKEMLCPGGRERFLREVQVTARLDHPAVVPVHDFGVHPDGQPFYCMKLIDGRTLETVIAETPILADRIALLQHIVTVADAISFAHNKGFLHRDLKPANILVGNFGETWVIDWGLTGVLASADEHRSNGPISQSDPAFPALTQTGEWLGTLPYMAPEQLESHDIDERADVYGLGAVLYHTLSGRRPYSDSEHATLLERIRTQQPTDLEKLAPELSPELLAISRKAMARNPADRYANARLFADDLRRFLAGRLVAAYHYRFVDVFRRWMRRHRPALIASLVAVIALLLGAIYGFQRISSERDTALHNEQQATKHRVAAEAASEEARESLASMWEEKGREELLRELRPLDAQDPLARAVELAPGRHYLRGMLAQAERPLHALRCEAAYHADGIFIHPTRPLAVIASSPALSLLLLDTTDCSATTEVVGHSIAAHAVEYSADGEAMHILASGMEGNYLFTRNLLTGESTELALSSIPFADGDLGPEGKFAALRGATGSLSSIVHFDKHSIARLYTAPTDRIRISLNGAWDAWKEGGRVVVRHFGEPLSWRPDADVVLAIDDSGSLLLSRDNHVEIQRRESEATRLERCGPSIASANSPVVHGRFQQDAPVVFALDRRKDLRAWRTDTGECLGAVIGRNVAKWALTSIGNQAWLVTLDGDARLSLWRVGVDLERVMTLSAHKTGVFDFDVNPTNGTLVTAGQDETVRVWDLQTLIGPPRVLRAPHIAVHPGGALVAVADHAKVQTVLSLRPDVVLNAWDLPELNTLSWSTSGQRLMARRGRQLLEWDPSAMATEGSIDAAGIFMEQGLEHHVVANTPLVVVSGSLERPVESEPTYDVRVYDRMSDRWHAFDVERSEPYPPDSFVDPDGTRMLLSTTGLLLDTASLTVVNRLTGASVMAPSGTGLVDLAEGGGLTLHDSSSGSRVQYYDYFSTVPHRERSLGRLLEAAPLRRGIARRHRAAVFSTSSDMFAALGTGQDVTLWEGSTGTQRSLLQGHRLPVYDARWIASGTRILTLGQDNLAILWDTESGVPLAEIQNVSSGARIAISPAGARLAIQDSPDQLTIFDVATGQRLLTFRIDSLADIVFADEQRLLVVEAPPGEEMSLQVHELAFD